MRKTKQHSIKAHLSRRAETLLKVVLIATLFMNTACSKELEYSSGDYVIFEKVPNSFSLAEGNTLSSIVIDSNDFDGVLLAGKNLQADIAKVCQQMPVLEMNNIPEGPKIIIGTIGKSKYIDQLIEDGDLDISAIKDKWEGYLISIVESQLSNGEPSMVIAGSDKRGTIYGIYDLSEKIGVSPWHFWSDVPAKQHKNIFIKDVTYADFPKVKYRGIFLNDEYPALGGWANENYGGFNHEFYEHVFDLILRLKGNFLWPAMWSGAFYDDDPQNPILADKMGVVIGTSHHEPLMRAHAEWARYGEGQWNYETNKENLQEFWRNSVKERKDYEAVITVGMRGDGDEAMTEGTAIDLLERIITDQREIMEEEFDKPAEEIPQAWALYKEVQDYYNKGMEVPEDITLLLCDDNWGNVRSLPKPGTPEREGGYGMYYHFDFVGGPVSYRWLNVTPISRTWEQMNLSWEHGVSTIWIVNVGDLKPMEFPIDQFLEQAWNPEAFTADKLPEFTHKWASDQFGEEYADEIAHLLTEYTRFNYRRTPEMLTPFTYSLANFREAERVVDEYNALYEKALQIQDKLPASYNDAFYQLVLHPIKACANLNAMYVATAKNYLYAAQGRAATNEMADEVEELFNIDADIEEYYHTELAAGKWNHMMSQPHIGYTSWASPPKNIMPRTEKIKLPKKAELGFTVEGSLVAWPNDTATASLPVFDQLNKQSYYIEVFNKGKDVLSYSLKPSEEWVELSVPAAESRAIDKQERVFVSIDWEKVPQGNMEATVEIVDQEGNTIPVEVNVRNAMPEDLKSFNGFVEANGYVSIEAAHFNAKKEISGMKWEVIPDFGRTLSGVTVLPSTHAAVVPGGNSPHLEYPVYLFNEGKVKVNVYVAPTLNIYNDEGMKYAVSFDGGEPIEYAVHKNDTIADWFYPQWWNQSVTDNIRILTTEHTISEAGPHMLKLWMVTPGLVFEKIVIETEEIGDTYLGPPESYQKK